MGFFQRTEAEAGWSTLPGKPVEDDLEQRKLLSDWTRRTKWYREAFRVDKIMHVSIESQKRNGEDIFRNFDFQIYISGTFGMFGGKEQIVKMEFENHFVGVVLDRFGQEVMLIPKDQEHFTMQARISISPQFYGWLAGLGTGAVIVSPENIRRDYISFLKKTLRNYGENNI